MIVGNVASVAPTVAPILLRFYLCKRVGCLCPAIIVLISISVACHVLGCSTVSAVSIFLPRLLWFLPTRLLTAKLPHWLLLLELLWQELHLIIGGDGLFAEKSSVSTFVSFATLSLPGFVSKIVDPSLSHLALPNTLVQKPSLPCHTRHLAVLRPYSCQNRVGLL